MEKAWVYETLFFQVVIVTLKEKKRYIKKIQGRSKLVLCIAEINYVNKSKVTCSFRIILYGLYFLAPFIFLLLLPLGTRSILVNFSPPGFYGPVKDLIVHMNGIEKVVQNEFEVRIQCCFEPFEAIFGLYENHSACLLNRIY